MTKNDRITIFHFLTRTGMFISTVDKNNIVSFIQGYELGSKNKCNFTQKINEILSNNYKILYKSEGWVGQINSLSQKKSLHWITTFKKIGIEIIVNENKGKLNTSLQKILKNRIKVMLEKLITQENQNSNENLKNDWLAFCDVNSNWFKQLWNEKEWKNIVAIDNYVKNNSILKS